MPLDLAALLSEGRWLLEQAEIETAALDARLLLQHAARVAHEELIAEPHRLISGKAGLSYRSMIARRCAHEPVSQIIGRREFYGRDFKITPAVLDPRPDTETLVEAALSFLPQDRPSTVLDLGTGSGAIIVSLLVERSLAEGAASDLSPAALAVARANAHRHGVAPRLTLIETSWWRGISGSFDLIVSNPPYIPHGAIADLETEVRNFDPATALDGGPDGLEAYRRITGGALAHLRHGGSILVEFGDGQSNAVTSIFQERGFSIANQRTDLGGRTRCLGFALR